MGLAGETILEFDIRTSFQSINILCVIPEQHFFLLQQSNKVVDSVGLVATGVELPGKDQERLGVVHKECDVKYCSGVWNLVLLEVVIETSTWCSGRERYREQ